MPFVNEPMPDVLALASGNLPDPELEKAPGFLATTMAALRTENVVGSILYNGRLPRSPYNPDYSPWEDIKGTHYEDYWESFAHSNSTDQTDLLKAQVDREAKDRETIRAAGVYGVIASMGASVVDPTILFPVVGQIKKIQGGYSVLRSALSVGAGSAAGAAVQEGVLQGTQELRTPEESVMAIGGAAVLGGLLGGVGARLLTKAEQKVALDAFDGHLEPASPGSAGSMAVKEPTLEDLTPAGRLAGALAKATQKLSPNLRLNLSPSARVRVLGQEMMETSLYQKMHARGETLGPSLETLIRTDFNRRVATSKQEVSGIYQNMKKAGVNMSWRDFQVEVGNAMSKGDKGANQFISDAAKSYRTNIVDPYYQELVNAGLLKEGDDVAFAMSYFPRRFNIKAMIANAPNVKKEWAAYISGRVKKQYAAESKSSQAKLAKLDEAINDYTLSPEERSRILGELTPVEARITEVERLRKEKPEGFEDAVTKLMDEGGPDFATTMKQRKKLRDQIKRMELQAHAVAKALDEVKAERAAMERAFADKWDIKHMARGEGDEANFDDVANEIVEDVFQRITAQDYGSSSAVQPDYLIPIARGPVIERTLPIPDEMLIRQGVLERNAEDVLSHYARVAGADSRLTDKYGTPSMKSAFDRVEAEYIALKKAAENDPKKLTKLAKRENEDVNDLRALRDLLRGTYKAAENASGFGRLSHAMTNLNYTRLLGGVVISSMADIYRIPMVHGLSKFLGDGVAPMLKNMKAVKLVRHEGQLAGTYVEKWLQHRIASIAELGDPIARGTPIERFLENASRWASKWNGILLWNDFFKGMSSNVMQDKLLDGATDKRLLAFLGVNSDMHKRILKQFNDHGETMDGIRVANTEKWKDPLAVQHYRAAVQKDVNSVIVTPGLGDAPLFSKTPLGRMLLQFRSFVFAAHQKVLLRGLQESKTRFLSSMVVMTAIGMLVSYLRAWRAGKTRLDKFEEESQNPGYLIAEGLDNTGIFSLAFDLANMTERLSPHAGFKFNPIKSPASYAGGFINPDAPEQGDSVKFAFRSPLDTLAGPSADVLYKGFKTMGAAADLAEGSELTESQKRSALGLIPFNSYLGFREMTQVLVEDNNSPYVD